MSIRVERVHMEMMLARYAPDRADGEWQRRRDGTSFKIAQVGGWFIIERALKTAIIVTGLQLNPRSHAKTHRFPATAFDLADEMFDLYCDAALVDAVPVDDERS